MPWEELEATCAPQFSLTMGAPANPVRLAFGALFIKQRLGLTDEETVEQIRENAYMQFFLGFNAEDDLLELMARSMALVGWRRVEEALAEN
jgi:hypothetical protein